MGAAPRLDPADAPPALRLVEIAPPAPERAAVWRIAAALLILGSVAAHFAYVAWFSPLDLASDEAHYWLWSRHLDWSYYSKGPLVAWLIHLSTTVAGPWAQNLAGHNVLAVRLPAILCGGLLLAGLHALARQTLRREKQALLAVALPLSFPLFSAGATLMTIDSPYCACWVWALVLTHRAVHRDCVLSWLGAGGLLLVGILAKYTMVLWVPCVGLYLMTTPEHRHHLLRWPFWTAVGIGALSAAPVVVWNSQHEWVTFRHVGWQAGVADRAAGVRWYGPLRFLAEQAAVLMVWWFCGWLVAMFRHRPTVERDTGRRFLWWMSAPVFGLFLLASVKTPGQMNWAVAAYVPGMVLAIGWAADRFADATPRGRRWIVSGGLANATLGLVLVVLVHFPGLARPALAAIGGKPRDELDTPLRRFDPTCRLRGWSELAKRVEHTRAELRGQGIDAVVAGTHWTHPGQLGFYLPDQPEVFSLGLAIGDRRSQLDFWRPNPIFDADKFEGRTFVIVGELTSALERGFDRVDPPVLVRYEEAGQPVAVWWITVAHGYRGYGPTDKLLAGQRY